MGHASENGYQRLVSELRRRAPVIARSPDIAWDREPAVRVIDCVLSLNRNYDRFLVPRLDAFEKKYPNVRSVRQLRDEIKKHPTPADFVRRSLNYNHAARADTLSAVVDWLSAVVAGNHLAPQQLKNLEKWAQSAKSEDYKKLAIHGFGLAGFQYLRMLFGANTTKPDIHICKFVEKYVGGKVSPTKALSLLEQAALELRSQSEGCRYLHLGKIRAVIVEKAIV